MSKQNNMPPRQTGGMFLFTRNIHIPIHLLEVLLRQDTCPLAPPPQTIVVPRLQRIGTLVF